ncbi:MAG TPA: hypothetical protein VL400_01940, partial [Polyangiaceae bacterium]|nr:hypothetical protein [Polyangiaceae bacterium]
MRTFLSSRRARSRVAKSLALVFFGVVGAVFVACDDLPDIEQGICGNSVVDRAAGEECDTNVADLDGSLEAACSAWVAELGLPASTTCRYECAAAEETNACQYVWGPSVDPDDSSPRLCPPGFAYGYDGVCRRPSNKFHDQPSFGIAASGFDGTSADLDGDGYRDFVVTAQGGAEGPSLTYLDASGVTFGPVSTGVSAVVGQLTTDDDTPIDDLALPIGAGLVTLRGEPGPSFAPKVYTPFPLTGTLPLGFPDTVTFGDRRLIANQSSDTFAVPFILAELHGLPSIGDAIAFVEISVENYGPADSQPFALPGFDFSKTVGEPLSIDLALPSAPVAEGDPPVPGSGGEIVLATNDVPGATQATKHAIIVTSRGIDPPTDGAVFDATSTPEYHVVLGKIVALLEVAAWPVPAVAAVLEDGRVAVLEQWVEPFDPSAPPPIRYFDLPKDGAEGGLVQPGSVRALGDIDGDGDLDVVTDHDVLFVDYDAPPGPDSPAPSKNPRIVGQSSSGPWSQARIADLNGQGKMSVIATPYTSGLALFLPGTSYAMTPASLATSARVDQLAIGDLDGDGVGDLLVGTDVEDRDANGAVTETCDTYDDILLGFGRTAGAPESLGLVGNVPGLRALVTGRLAIRGQEDAISDAGLQTACDPTTLMAGGSAGLLIGSSDRNVYSPYLPFNGPGERDALISAAALGDFGATSDEEKDHADLMLLAIRPMCTGGGQCGLNSADELRYEIATVYGSGDAELGVDADGQLARSTVIDTPKPKDLQNIVTHVPALITAELDDASPGDEGVAFIVDPDQTLQARISVIRSVAGDVTADTVSFDTGLDAPITHSKLRAIDYDGDGNVDVLAVVAYS